MSGSFFKSESLAPVAFDADSIDEDDDEESGNFEWLTPAQIARRERLRRIVGGIVAVAAVALVAVCVWLIVWLVVFGKVLPDDIVGFAAVVFQVTVKSGVFALLFARYVAGAGTVVAPAAPEGKVGTAPGLRAWAHEAFELDAARTRERGGVDAELHVRRIRMRLACLEVWALLAVPLACIYALDPKRCGWLPERKVVEEEPCTGANPCCGWKDLKKEDKDNFRNQALKLLELDQPRLMLN